ncbi:MAG: Rdx family protein [Planctomycetota bacterium]|nr:Rdx family protein [Planctomycetota bacterium]MDP6938999.1 Rdx family protein [Planctomycetota bacterium]
MESSLEDLQVELVAGGGGVFDVSCDGRLVYSKHQTGQFPNLDDVVHSL